MPIRIHKGWVQYFESIALEALTKLLSNMRETVRWHLLEMFGRLKVRFSKYMSAARHSRLSRVRMTFQVPKFLQ